MMGLIWAPAWFTGPAIALAQHRGHPHTEPTLTLCVAGPLSDSESLRLGFPLTSSHMTQTCPLRALHSPSVSAWARGQQVF